MIAKVMIFDDGSLVIWKDRESVKYEEKDGRAVIVWVDYDAGFFNRGRIIRENSLEYWHTSPSETNEPISAEKKAEIIAKLRQYFGNTIGNRPVRVEQ